MGVTSHGPKGDEIWELWLTTAKTPHVVNQCIETTEPAYLAKHAFQMAQLFNTFYHRHPILAEADDEDAKPSCWRRPQSFDEN